MLDINSGLEAKTIFTYLQEKYNSKFQDGQLRTLQRKIKIWRALEGPPKEVFFPQVHRPGELSQSDFTDLSAIGITIQRKKFDHLLYHFVLTYSNWETGTVCFSESYESISLGLQNALWELGCVPKYHQTDCLSAAVNNLSSKDEFTEKYNGLLKHYKLSGKKTNPESPNENGDIEQSHNRFQKALSQKLMLRGSRDFDSREEYQKFLKTLFDELNSNRSEKFKEELKQMKQLPLRRLESCTVQTARVTKFSTINIRTNIYSLHSRLRGEIVKVKIYPENLQVWYAGKMIDNLPRLIGKKKHRINYRHIIDWLVRKPGAFANYRYRDDLFPTIHFRIAYDKLQMNYPSKADKEYLQILYLAATESEIVVNDVLKYLINKDYIINKLVVESLLNSRQQIKLNYDVEIDEVDLADFDILLDDKEVA